jgi:hypothetical protein
VTFPASFFVHTVQVKTYLGRTGSGGDSFAAPVTKTGFLDDDRKLVLSPTGEQVVSESTWYTSLADAAIYPVGSVLITGDRDAQVIGVKRRDSGPLGLPDHLEVTLT